MERSEIWQKYTNEDMFKYKSLHVKRKIPRSGEWIFLQAEHKADLLYKIFTNDSPFMSLLSTTRHFGALHLPEVSSGG